MTRSDAARRRLDALLDSLADLRRYRATVTRDKLLDDRDVQHMVLHAMYVATQATIDLAFHVLAAAGAPMPATYQGAFRELVAAGLLPAELGQRLSGWAGLRNVLAHHYPAVDYARVHQALVDDLGDIEAFAAAATSWLDRAS